jgi:hypothetical protein
MDTKRNDTFMFRPNGDNKPGIDRITPDGSNKKSKDK